VACDDKTLSRIYDRTSGYCHICGKKMSFTNYALPGRKGAWEIEHSVPRSKGGTDHANNLFGAHIACNRDKSDHTTQTARNWHGRKRAPLSRAQRKDAQSSNTIGGAVIGGLIGLAGGPAGVIAGSLIGAGIGSSMKPE
jgi:5-methylcytosine-specific restriction endonuclease McrA